MLYSKLTVTSDGADKINVRCSDGQVKVNGQDPTSGPFACGDLQAINVTGGPGNNKISLAAVTPLLFPKLGVFAADDYASLIVGQGGNDRIVGSPFDDVILAGGGKDRVNSLAGNDSIFDECDAGAINGGPGTDTLRVDDVTSSVVLSPQGMVADGFTKKLTNIEGVSVDGEGDNGLLFDASQFSGPVTLQGANGNDTLVGGMGNDHIAGNLGDDSMLGGLGNDTLAGHVGSDTLHGQSGDDDLTGGVDADYLYGGSGTAVLDSDATDDVVLQDDIIIIFP
jgi:Ca2+-binding RTX toxin-like protein